MLPPGLRSMMLYCNSCKYLRLYKRFNWFPIAIYTIFKDVLMISSILVLSFLFRTRLLFTSNYEQQRTKTAKDAYDDSKIDKIAV